MRDVTPQPRSPIRALIALLHIIAIGVLLCAAQARAETKVRLDPADEAVYDSLAQPDINPTACYALRSGSVWQSPLGDFSFQEGQIAFFNPVGGRPSGCYFSGKADFRFDPERHLERTQLKRYTDDSILTASCDNAYIRFCDTATARAILACCDTTTIVSPDTRSSRLRWFEEQAGQHLTLDFGARSWEVLTNLSDPVPWLYIRPNLKGKDNLHFFYDPSGDEDVTAWYRPSGVTSRGVVDLVCSYNDDRYPLTAASRQAWLDNGIDIGDYHSTIDLSNSGNMILDVAVACRSRRDGLVALPFTTAPDLKFDSILVNQTPCSYIYDEDGGWLVVKSPEAFNARQAFLVRFFYRGDRLLDKLPWGDFFIHHTVRWLPRTSVRRRSTYTTTFRYPRHYDVVSVGDLIADTTVNDIRIATWQTIGEVKFISFNYGSFEELDQRMADGIQLRIYRGKNHLDGLFSSNYKEIVAADIDGSMQLFEHLFGKYPWDHLSATEIPGSHGQGFPQLLHLAYASFENNRKGVMDAFRAHEVAHQWFGHMVGWDSYHDQWLSEGFAEYAGAMFVQVRHKGNDEFFKLLKDWRELILSRGGHQYWHDGPDVAPIWMGFRCASNRSPASYQYIVYQKGAYVLHMLRQMLYDYARGSDQRFISLMHDYIATYNGRDPSTADFQKIIEAHVHQPMDWFFRQWVYGTQIPRFEYSWEREQQADGQWVIRGTIKQFDTDPPFRVFMPITIKFDDSRRRTFLQEINSAVTTFESPPMDLKPDELIFNDYHSVLCREKLVKKP